MNRHLVQFPPSPSISEGGGGLDGFCVTVGVGCVTAGAGCVTAGAGCVTVGVGCVTAGAGYVTAGLESFTLSNRNYMDK